MLILAWEVHLAQSDIATVTPFNLPPRVTNFANCTIIYPPGGKGWDYQNVYSITNSRARCKQCCSQLDAFPLGVAMGESLGNGDVS